MGAVRSLRLSKRPGTDVRGRVVRIAGADWRAMHVISACERAHVHVPDSVALLGVDNDEFLCAHVSPPLSSILPGHVEMGRRAAEMLERLVSGKVAGRHKSVSVPPKAVIERESTKVRTPSAILVDRAKRFIHSNAQQGIDVKDVVEHLRVSRSPRRVSTRLKGP